MKKNWLITGASSGLGRIMVERLLARGDKVAATLRRAGALDDLQTQYADALQVLPLDLTDVVQIRATVDQAFRQFGRIDVAVSNAGYGLFGAGEEVSDAQIERQIATNLTGSIQFIRALLPQMRGQGGGRIVQVSSEGGQVAYPNFSLYHATKWGIEGFIESVSQEVAPFNIDFLIAEPGPTATNFAAGLDNAETMDVYDQTPAGDVRRAVRSGSFVIRGDARKTIDAIIAAADSCAPPLRLALGSTAYASINKALNARLKGLESHKDITVSVDAD